MKKYSKKIVAWIIILNTIYNSIIYILIGTGILFHVQFWFDLQTIELLE